MTCLNPQPEFWSKEYPNFLRKNASKIVIKTIIRIPCAKRRATQMSGKFLPFHGRLACLPVSVRAMAPLWSILGKRKRNHPGIMTRYWMRRIGHRKPKSISMVKLRLGSPGYSF